MVETELKIFFLFDGNCAFCRDGVKILENYEYDVNIKFITCQDYNSCHDQKLDCKKSSYFILNDKSKVEYFSGASGVNHLFRRISNNNYLKYFGYLYLIPPINILEDFCYYVIKKNRKRIKKIYAK